MFIYVLCTLAVSGAIDPLTVGHPHQISLSLWSIVAHAVTAVPAAQHALFVADARGAHALVVRGSEGILQLEQLLLGGAEALHQLSGVVLQVFDYLVLLEDDLLQGVDAALFLGVLGPDNLHLLLGHFELLLETRNLLVLLLDALQGLLVDLLKRLFHLSLLILALLALGLAAGLFVLDEVYLDDLVVFYDDRGLSRAVSIPEVLISLALLFFHSHPVLHDVVVLALYLVLLGFQDVALLGLVGDLELQAVVCLHQRLDLILQVSVLFFQLLFGFFQLFLEVGLECLLFFEELGDLLLEAFSRLLQALSLGHERIVHIRELLQLLALLLILLVLFREALIAAVLLMLLQQRHILLLQLLELSIVALQLLAFGSERHDFLFLLLQVLLLGLQLLLVVVLAVAHLAHLLLLLLHELLVVIELQLEAIDLLLLLSQLCLY